MKKAKTTYCRFCQDKCGLCAAGMDCWTCEEGEVKQRAKLTKLDNLQK